MLANQARALLRLENDLSPDAREKIQWLLRVEFEGTKIVLGKGGANTFHIVYGDGERAINYPNKILAELDALGRQDYVLYRVGSKDAGWKKFFALQSALALKPRPGFRIMGTAADGSHSVCRIARKNIKGMPAWLVAK